MCGVKTSSLYQAPLRLAWMCTSWVFRRRIWYPTSSHFLRRNCRPQGRSSLRISHSGVCRHVYGYLFSTAWILIHRWTRVASSFADSRPLFCCTNGPLPVDADVSVLSQSKDIDRRVSRFHGDGFWLSVPIFVGDLGIWCCFSCCHCPVSKVKYPDVAILGCWCVRAVLLTNGGHNTYRLWSDVIWPLWTFYIWHFNEL